jgi:hypothetical protein
MNPTQLGPHHLLVSGGQSIQNIQRYRQQQLYQERQKQYENEEDSSSEEEYEQPNIPLQYFQEPKKRMSRKRFLKDNLLISYSGDRNFEGGEKIFDYTITFNETQSGSSKSNAFFNTNLKNIRSISILDVVMPNFYLDLPLLHGLANQFYYTPLSDNNTNLNDDTKPMEHDDNLRLMRPPRLQDLPFILLKIRGLEGDLKGTNTDIDSSTCMLTIEHIRSTTNNASGTYEVLNKAAPDTFDNSDNNPELKKVQKGNTGKHILAETDKNILYFKNKTGIQKLFYPNPLARLGTLKIDLYDHLGNPLRFQHEYLEIDRIEVHTPAIALENGPAPTDSSSSYIEIRTKQLYSPEEFRVGDLLRFQNVQANPRNISLESFLNRKEGHILIQHQHKSRYKASPGTLFDNYFNKFYIFTQVIPALSATYSDAAEMALSTELGSKYIIHNNYSGGYLNISSGICINQSMQHTISFNIKTEEHVYDTEDTELI